MRHTVRYLGNRIDRVHVAIPRDELRRWPLVGRVTGAAVAFSFDGPRLRLIFVGRLLGCRTQRQEAA